MRWESTYSNDFISCLAGTGYDYSRHELIIQQKKVHLLCNNDVVKGPSSNVLSLSHYKTNAKFSSQSPPRKFDNNLLSYNTVSRPIRREQALLPCHSCFSSLVIERHCSKMLIRYRLSTLLSHLCYIQAIMNKLLKMK